MGFPGLIRGRRPPPFLRTSVPRAPANRSEPAPAIRVPRRPACRGSAGPDPAAGRASCRGTRSSGPRGRPTMVGNQIRLQFEGSATFDAWIEAIQSRPEVRLLRELRRPGRPGGARLPRGARGQGARGRAGAGHLRLGGVLGNAAALLEAAARGRRRGACVQPAPCAGRPLRRASSATTASWWPWTARWRSSAASASATSGRARATSAPWRDTGAGDPRPRGPGGGTRLRAALGRDGRALVPGATVADPPRAGDTPVWLIEGEPGSARVYRTLHLVAARARSRIWITDAYFVAPRPISEALAAAARQGVDVRILVPAHNNWPLVGSLSRGRLPLPAGERGADVRVAGPDDPRQDVGRWTAPGAAWAPATSTRPASSGTGRWTWAFWIGGLASQLEGLFLADLASSVEIVLPARGQVPVSTVPG